MAEILSQNEIDALLSALSSGDVEAEEIELKEEEKHKVKNYDFKSPQKFSKDHIRTLEKVHDNFARIISNYLTGQLRRSVRVSIQSVEQVTYEEFIRSIPNPTIISNFRMPPLQGNILLEINPQFAFQILEILLGGAGDREGVNKEFTDIEKNIISNACEGIIHNFKLAWAKLLEVEPQFDGIETNPTANQSLAPNEPVALLNFFVEIGTTNTYINVCIPYLAIEKILDKLVVQHWFHGSESGNDAILDGENIKGSLNPVDVEVQIELGDSYITIDDFLKLRIGDVIKIDSRCDSPVKVCIENEPCYIGKPGTIGKNLAVEILDTINKDVDRDE